MDLSGKIRRIRKTHKQLNVWFSLDCEVWFDQATRPRRYVGELPRLHMALVRLSADVKGSKIYNQSSSKEHRVVTDEEIPRYKNVRWSAYEGPLSSTEPVRRLGRRWESRHPQQYRELLGQIDESRYDVSPIPREEACN